MATLIQTGKVTGRRPLKFESLDDILADLEGLARGREIQSLGNWSSGQNLKHVATVMNRSIDGFDSRLPAVLRLLFRLLMKRRFLNRPMVPGFQLPAKAKADLVPGPTSQEEGIEALRHAIKRLQTETHRVPSPVLGPLTVDEWNQMHCRHAELHLSFLHRAD